MEMITPQFGKTPTQKERKIKGDTKKPLLPPHRGNEKEENDKRQDVCAHTRCCSTNIYILGTDYTGRYPFFLRIIRAYSEKKSASLETHVKSLDRMCECTH
jgi:hypothetical protein